MKKNIVIFSAVLVQMIFAFSISIDQPSFHLETEKGGRQNFDIVVNNQNDHSFNVKVYAEDWVYQKNGAKQFLPAGQSKYSCAGWITSAKKELIVPANSKETISFTIATPVDAVGGHQAVIFFESIPQEATPNNGIIYGARIGSIIYQETKSGTVTKLEIEKRKIFRMDSKDYYELVVKNGGNAWNSVKGTISLVENKEVKLELKHGPLNMLPGETVSLNGYFPGTHINPEILYVLEDHKGNLLSGSFKEFSQTGIIDQRISEISKELPIVNPADPSISLERYDTTYDPKKSELKIVVGISANVQQKAATTVKVYNAKTKDRVKTVQFNEKILKPGKLETMSVVWPVYNSLPKGEYDCALLVEYGEHSITENRTIVIK